MNGKKIINEFIKSTEVVNLTITAEFRNLTLNQLNRKPSEESWSIAECIEHLIITNYLYFNALSDAIGADKSLESDSKNVFRHTITGRLMMRYLNPDSDKKLPTTGTLKPAQSRFGSDVFDRFSEISKKLIALAEQFRTINLSSVKFHSPVSSFIRLNAGDALVILMYHDRRHLNQMKEILQHIN